MKNDETRLLTDNTTLEVLDAAYKAWREGAVLRQVRKRNKDFTYGRQLNDMVIMPDGKAMTEKEAILATGKEPLTNNLIRQLVKSVVGRYRDLAKSREVKSVAVQDIYESNSIVELDCRMLEEFLISGCCVQKIEMQPDINGNVITVNNVNVNRFFINNVSDIRCRDCNIIGELHDLSIAEIIMRLARGDRNKAMKIRELYSTDLSARLNNAKYHILGEESEDGLGFWTTNKNGKCRVIEVWTLESREVIRCHDYERGEWYILPVEDAAVIDEENLKRAESGLTEIERKWDIVQVWRCRWITPMGDLLAEYDSPFPHRLHPYVVKLYPLTDGEIHAFVEDVIDQQKYVNRLITLVDHIMNSSAKGVLLYPTDALPAGYTWKDLQHLWTTPNAIIPYDCGKENMPKQISTNATNIGAYELLSLEMKLFEEISGVSGALQGRSVGNNVGAALYERQSENSAIALADIFDTFESFRNERDAKLSTLVE